MTRHARPGDAFKRRQMEEERADARERGLCTHCFREMPAAWQHAMHRVCMNEILRRYDEGEPEGSPPVRE